MKTENLGTRYLAAKAAAIEAVKAHGTLADKALTAYTLRPSPALTAAQLGQRIEWCADTILTVADIKHDA